MIAGVGGPPIAILYRGTAGNEFRPSLNAVFTFGITITLGLLLISGEIFRDHLTLVLYLAVPVAIGLRLSSFFSNISEMAISRGVTYFSIISGLFVILRNII